MADTPQAPRLRGIAGELTNMFYRNGSWVRRRSAQAIHATAYGGVLAGVFAFKDVSSGTTSTPTYELMAATRGVVGGALPTFLRLIGSALTPITMAATYPPEAFADDLHREWRIAQPDNTRAFACRLQSKNGRLLHVDKTRATDAGIAAPTACTVTNTATASAHPGGVYAACKYTFVTAEGSESSASPASASATLAAGDSRRWTLQVSTHARVTKRRLYVPFAGADNVVAYFAVDVNDNTTTTYDEATLDSALANLVAPTRNGVPPEYPEDCWIFDERLWVASNDPSPGWWYSDIDSLGPAWEAFSTSRVLRIPPRGGRRVTAGRAWDRERNLLFTDSSAHVARVNGTGYTIEDLSPYGCQNASCAAVGDGGVAVWFDGRNVVRSDGGAAEVCSRGWVDRVLSKIPADYVDRSSLFYSPEEGLFMLSIPSAAASTEPDMVLAYDAMANGGMGEWHRAGWFWTGSAHVAPTAWGHIPAGAATRVGQTPEWTTVACFASDNRIMWMGAPSLRDEGPKSVRCVMLSAPIASDARSLAVSRVAIGVGARKDAQSEAVPSDASFAVRLRLDGNRYNAASVMAQRNGKGQYVYARAQNLGDVAGFVQVELTADVDHLLEVFDLQAEVVPFNRDGGRA